MSSSLLFAGIDQAALPAPGACLDGPVRLFATLEAARTACDGPILVVDAARLEHALPEPDGERIAGATIPRAAVLNLDPYRPPCDVEAGGGYVLRAGEREPELVVIFRRGVWDLPKGKCEGDEALSECARREVEEEVGLTGVRLLAPLPTTVHAYPHGARYAVKTTHWYLMAAEGDALVPQAEEDIERACWMPWREATARLGYATLREHAQAVAADAWAAARTHLGMDLPALPDDPSLLS